jgi:hypothetical protein
MTENKVEQGKNYRWSPNDKIEITGMEYDILQKTLAVFEGAYLFKDASKVKIDILQRMIEQGIATEFDDTELPTAPPEPETEQPEGFNPVEDIL